MGLSIDEKSTHMVLFSYRMNVFLEAQMDALTYTQVRKDFAGIMNKVCEDHRPLIITRQNRSPVVMISLEDFNAIEETMYLVKNPKNAKRLMASIQKAERGLAREEALIEE